MTELPRHIIVDAGFHKTGPTSVRHTPGENADLARNDLLVVVRPDIRRATHASAPPHGLRRALFGAAVTFALRRLPTLTDRRILIPPERLSDPLSGRRGPWRFGNATPPAAKAPPEVS